MKRGYLVKLFLSILSAGLLYSCSKNIYENAWESRNLKADRTSNEWDKPLRYYDAESRLQYNVTNDSVNLYVSIRATDQQNQLKIIRSGMQLWIDTIGKKKNQTGIFYPLASTYVDSTRKTEIAPDRIRAKQFQKSGANTLKNRFGNEPKQMQLTGFKPPIGGITPLQNEYRISANISWDSKGIMNYQAIIPFNSFCKNALSASGSQRIFTVSIIIPPLRTQTNSGRGGGYGRAPGGMGRGMSSGMGGGRMGGAMRGGESFGGGGRGGGGGSRNFDGTRGQSTLNELTRITMKIKLALNPK